MPYQHFGDRDLVGYLCIYGSMLRDLVDGMLCFAHIVATDIIIMILIK
jgi:hypothetical protein